MSGRDRMFSNPGRALVDFEFDEEVAGVFDDMIRRSVPGYETVVPNAALLAAKHLERNPALPAHVYDLGCSLGASAAAVARLTGSCRITAVDNAAPMIERARQLVTSPGVEFRCADLRHLELEPAGVVLLNYVLQFVPPEERVPVLAKIRACLDPGGLLIVSEKVRFEDPDRHAFFDGAHLDYKRANGYSELEISAKRTALERVMIVDSEEAHRQRFAEAGFTRTDKWFQCLNWVSYLVYP